MGSSLSNILKNAPADVLVNLKCIKCSEFLTCPPIIWHLGIGNSCGRCCSDKDVKDGESVRNIAFEALAKLQQLPCRYSECSDILEFDNVLSHEQFCAFKKFKCAVLPETCDWKEVKSKLKEHYTKNHAEMLCNKDTALSLNLHNDFKQNIFIDELGKPFLFYISYKMISNKFKCVLVYFEKPDAKHTYSYEICLKTQDEQIKHEKKEFVLTSVKCIAATSLDISESDLVVLDLKKLELLIEKCQFMDIKVKNICSVLH